MEALGNTRLDGTTGHQGRSQIRSIARSPRPEDVHLVRLDPITFQVLEGSIAGQSKLVGKPGKSPLFAPGLPAAHQRVAPIEAAATGDVDVDALVDPRFCEGDQRMPIAVQVRAIIDEVRAVE